jgi:hypothetical protein
MLFRYWLLGFVAGAPFALWYGHGWLDGPGWATLFYFVRTLAAGIEAGIHYQSLRIYALWDAAAFVVAFVLVLIAYVIPHDRPGLPFADWKAMLWQGLLMASALYWIMVLVLQRAFSARIGLPRSSPGQSPSAPHDPAVVS